MSRETRVTSDERSAKHSSKKMTGEGTATSREDEIYLLGTLGLFAAENVEDDVEQEAAAADDDGWCKHEKSPFPWDGRNVSNSATAVWAKGRATWMPPSWQPSEERVALSQLLYCYSNFYADGSRFHAVGKLICRMPRTRGFFARYLSLGFVPMI